MVRLERWKANRISEHPMSSPLNSARTTPKTLNMPMAEDTAPVFLSTSAAAGYAAGADAHVRPGIPEDTARKTQTQEPQGEASGMPGQARKSTGRTRRS